MVKYATKNETQSRNFYDIYKNIISNANENAHAKSLLKSIMLRSCGLNRDMGQSEITHLILGQPLFRSTYQYVHVSLDRSVRKLNLQTQSTDSNSITQKNSILLIRILETLFFRF